MNTLSEIVTEELPTIKALLGESGQRIRQAGDTIQMKLKSTTPKDIRLIRSDYFYFKYNMRNHYAPEVEYINNLKETLADMGYIIEFHYSSQGSCDATMVLHKICPCCGNY